MRWTAVDPPLPTPTRTAPCETTVAHAAVACKPRIGHHRTWRSAFVAVVAAAAAAVAVVAVVIIVAVAAAAAAVAAVAVVVAVAAVVVAAGSGAVVVCH